MSDIETPKGTDTLVKKATKVQIGENTYTIATFKFGKTVRALALVTEVAAAAGIEDATKRLMGDSGDGDNLTIAGILGQVVAVLPKMLSQGVPSLYKLIGLIVTSNKDLYGLETDDEADVDDVLYKKGRELAWEGEPSEIMEILSAGVAQVGIESILGNLAPLVRTLLKR